LRPVDATDRSVGACPLAVVISLRTRRLD